MIKNRNVLIIALIAVVNALGYGIIIPILYSYSHRFGLSDFQNGLLFALFSLCSFISTPIIGRLSDKYGRRPLLIGSMAGTALSFVMLAFAPNAAFLFLARALDGLTAGNIPVALAVISDTTEPHERARGFGVIGAAFSFGFTFGPAISALTVGYSYIVPFLVAATIAMIAVIATYLYLPETNKHLGHTHEGKLFDFARMWHALWDPAVGITFWLTLLISLAFFLFVYSFQPYSTKVLHLHPTEISILFTIFGVSGLVAQAVAVGFLTKKFGQKHTLTGSFIVIAGAFMVMAISGSLTPFAICCLVVGTANSIINPLLQAVLSHEADPKLQGAMQGLNTSYMNIGQIFGPIVGGALATFGLTIPFIAGGLVSLVCFVLSFQVLHRTLHHPIT